MSTNVHDEAKSTLIKLRELTGAGMMDCKKALDEAKGDLKKAQEIIRKKGLDIAKKKSTREVKEGQVVPYIHTGGKLGVLVEINCESDFVARNEIFQSFARDVAMQVAAAHPLYVSQELIPEADMEREKALHAGDLSNKPKEVQDKIIQGKLAKRFEEICLLDQKFIKDDTQTVRDYLNETIAKLGENMVIRRFVRFEVGGQ